MRQKSWMVAVGAALAIGLVGGTVLAQTAKRITPGTIEASNDIWKDRAGLSFLYAPSPPPIDPTAPSPPPIIEIDASRFAGLAEKLVIVDTDGSRLAVVSIPALGDAAPVSIVFDDTKESRVSCEPVVGDPAAPHE